MIGLFIVLLVVALALYAYLLHQRIHYDQMLVDMHLKDIIAIIHRRVDQCAALQHDIMALMPAEAQVWQELDEARHAVLRAITDYNADLIAAADSEFSRCLYDLQERMQGISDIASHPSALTFRHDMATLQQELDRHVERYNAHVQQFNCHIKKLPRQLLAEFSGVRRKRLFMHQEATIGDHHIEAIVIE